MLKHRAKYTKEFKVETVELVTKQDYSCSEAARSLGISPDLVSRWKREQTTHEAEAFPGHGQSTPEQQRIRDLEKQVNRLQMEKEILKQATVFFARDETVDERAVDDRRPDHSR